MNFQLRLFCWLSLSFVLATVIGTLSHESGHYMVAKYFGYDARISYGYTPYQDIKNRAFMDSIYSKYQREIATGRSFPGKLRFNEIREKHKRNGFWITLGGPLQTMVTGTIGLIFLFRTRRSYKDGTPLNFKQWFIIFISLFWLRQTANLFTGIIGYVSKGHFSSRGDEIRLANEWQLPPLTLLIVTAFLGAIVLITILYNFIPTKQRLTFVLSGLTGGIVGYSLWLIVLGKYIMP